jgi:hypothetical protein
LPLAPPPTQTILRDPARLLGDLAPADDIPLNDLEHALTSAVLVLRSGAAASECLVCTKHQGLLERNRHRLTWFRRGGRPLGAQRAQRQPNTRDATPGPDSSSVATVAAHQVQMGGSGAVATMATMA